MRFFHLISLLGLIITLVACGTTVAPPTSTPAPTVAQPTATLPPPPPTTAPTEPPLTPPLPTAAPTAETADGRIFFVAPDRATIMQMQPDGSAAEVVEKLELNQGEWLAHLSGDPSGQYLLYCIINDSDYKLECAVRGSQGSTKLDYTFNYPPLWAPVGTKLAASTGMGEMQIYEFDTGAPRLSETLDELGTPTWFPDGRRLIYVNLPDSNNLFSYDLAGKTSTPITSLATDDNGDWIISDAYVLPDGEHAIFFGGQQMNLGASGNGRQWWYVALAGGEAKPLSEQGGNGIMQYAVSPRGDWISYIENAHGGACMSEQVLVVQTSDVSGGIALNVPNPLRDMDNDRYTSIRGFSWAPDNQQIVYAIEPYSCGEDMMQVPEEPRIFLWDMQRGSDPTANDAPVELAAGSLPVWVP